MRTKTPKLVKLVDSHVGKRIRERRTLLGFTQEHLASTLKLSYQQVQKYETGANRVSAGRLYEIATKLDVPVSYFYDGLKKLSEVEALPHGGKSRSAIDLVGNYADITDPVVRATVTGLVKSLARQARRQEKAAAAAKSRTAKPARTKAKPTAKKPKTAPKVKAKAKKKPARKK